MILSLRRYGFAALMAFGATLLLWGLRDVLTTANFSLVYLLVVLVVAVYYGTAPSLFTALISFLSFNFFLVKPLYTFFVADPRDVLDLVIYLACAALTGQLASYARNQRRDAEQRANELNILYEAAAAFNQLTDSESVYRTLDHILHERLSVLHTEVLPPISLLDTDGQNRLNLPLSIGAHRYGILRITFTRPPTSALTRLASICTSQAATVLQRIELAHHIQESESLKEADRLKTALLHAVSHDLRTPLTIIKTSASNLSRLDSTLPPPDRLDMLHAIESEADHLNKMVGNLLDISRLQAGALQINGALNSLEEVAGDVAARTWQVTGTERIVINFPPDMTLVYFDYGLVLQALSNLVENGLRYEPSDSRLTIAGKIIGHEAQVAIVNHGPSIPAAERDLIMEPFYHSAGGNTGLGLAIAKGIIEAHQGRLWVEDTPSGGATFIFSLPLTNMDTE
ncbi:MAG: DUF4118 domain-containing protein [Chloroflexota bacterium]